jgi:hypothetical protein
MHHLLGSVALFSLVLLHLVAFVRDEIWDVILWCRRDCKDGTDSPARGGGRR